MRILKYPEDVINGNFSSKNFLQEFANVVMFDDLIMRPLDSETLPEGTWEAVVKGNLSLKEKLKIYVDYRTKLGSATIELSREWSADEIADIVGEIVAVVSNLQKPDQAYYIDLVYITGAVTNTKLSGVALEHFPVQVI